MKRFLVPGLLIALSLSGCEGGASGPELNHSVAGQTNSLSATLPIMLRSVPIDDLFATIIVDNTRQTLSGTDFSGTTWNIELELEPNQTHPIVIEWHGGTHLLLEEYGELFTSTESPVIQPELEYISGGFPRFDSDCDGISNLEEIVRGTDINIAEGSNSSPCDAFTAQLTEANPTWVVKQLRGFEYNGIEEPVSSYGLNMQVRHTHPNLRSDHVVSLIGEGEFDTARKMLIEIVHDPVDGNYIRVYGTDALNGEDADIEGASCFPLGEDMLGYDCRRPYDWQENEWYQLRYTLITPTRWQATLIPELDGQEVLIGTLDFPAQPQWRRSQLSMNYHENATEENCRLGLPLLNMRFTAGVVNEMVTLEPGILVQSDCLKAGPGSGQGVRTIDGELIYDLKIGGTH